MGNGTLKMTFMLLVVMCTWLGWHSQDDLLIVLGVPLKWPTYSCHPALSVYLQERDHLWHVLPSAKPQHSTSGFFIWLLKNLVWQQAKSPTTTLHVCCPI